MKHASNWEVHTDDKVSNCSIIFIPVFILAMEMTHTTYWSLIQSKYCILKYNI